MWLDALRRHEGNPVRQKLRLELLLGTLIVGQVASHLKHQGFLMCHICDSIPRQHHLLFMSQFQHDLDQCFSTWVRRIRSLTQLAQDRL